MKTAAICSSMKFSAEMKQIAFLLETRHGINVLQCIEDPDREITAQEKKALEAAHRRKIELADAIYVVDIGGYIGQSVGQEIEFARSLGKEIIYHSRFSL